MVGLSPRWRLLTGAALRCPCLPCTALRWQCIILTCTRACRTYVYFLSASSLLLVIVSRYFFFQLRCRFVHLELPSGVVVETDRRLYCVKLKVTL